MTTLTTTQRIALVNIRDTGRLPGRVSGPRSRMLDRLRDAGLIEYGGASPFRITKAGRAAIAPGGA